MWEGVKSIEIGLPKYFFASGIVNNLFYLAVQSGTSSETSSEDQKVVIGNVCGKWLAVKMNEHRAVVRKGNGLLAIALLWMNVPGSSVR